jgi:hypothetical protein
MGAVTFSLSVLARIQHISEEKNSADFKMDFLDQHQPTVTIRSVAFNRYMHAMPGGGVTSLSISGGNEALGTM